MLKFIETTPEEVGFARLWDRHVAPDLDTYGRAYWRAIWIMSVSWIGLTIAFFISFGVIKGLMPAEDDIYATNLVILASFALCCGIGYLAYLPYKKLADESAHRLAQALGTHFQDQFRPLDAYDDLKETADFLADEGLVHYGSAELGAAFQCLEGGRLFRFFNCTYTSGTGNRRTVAPYLILHLKLDHAIPSKVKIKTDRGRFGNFFIRLFSRRRNVRLSNRAFEKQFEVYSDDADLTHRLLSEAVQQCFVDMQKYFSQGRSFLQGACEVTCMIEGDEMIVCLSGLDDVAGHKMAGGSPRKVLKAAHTGIKRLSQIPLVVENLQNAMPQIRR